MPLAILAAFAWAIWTQYRWASVPPAVLTLASRAVTRVFRVVRLIVGALSDAPADDRRARAGRPGAGRV